MGTKGRHRAPSFAILFVRYYGGGECSLLWVLRWWKIRGACARKKVDGRSKFETLQFSTCCVAALRSARALGARQTCPARTPRADPETAGRAREVRTQEACITEKLRRLAARQARARFSRRRGSRPRSSRRSRARCERSGALDSVLQMTNSKIEPVQKRRHLLRRQHNACASRRPPSSHRACSPHASSSTIAGTHSSKGGSTVKHRRPAAEHTRTQEAAA